MHAKLRNFQLTTNTLHLRNDLVTLQAQAEAGACMQTSRQSDICVSLGRRQSDILAEQSDMSSLCMASDVSSLCKRTKAMQEGAYFCSWTTLNSAVLQVV